MSFAGALTGLALPQATVYGHGGHVDPSAIPLTERARIRGAMWTARLDVPWGPRPNQPDNCICIDYFECFSPADQDRIIAAYGPTSPRGYTHAPMGPVCDAGYHGQLPSVDFRTGLDPYLDGAQKLEDAGIRVIHFLRPDRGCYGLDWTVADLDRELTPLFSTPRAQRLMAITCLGWEPGPRYYYDNAWWVEMLQWQARVFPNALRCIHMVSDCDAPTGGNDDQLGLTNDECWRRCVPDLHVWLVQNGGYVVGSSEVPTPQFVQDFTNQFNPSVPGSFPSRFEQGYAHWPTTSAWGTRGLLAIPAEYAAFGDYWQNWGERYSQDLGDAAVAAGAAGYLDGGRVAVP